MKNIYSKARFESLGFTLLELMVTIAIVAIIVTAAIPSNYYQQTKSVNYANIALQQARSYANLVNENYLSYYNQAKLASNNVVTVPYTVLVSNSYSIASGDIYGNSPCLAIRLNTTTNILDMVMYYTNTTANVNATDKSMTLSASNYLNGMAGQFNSITNQVVGAFNTWTIPGNSPLFSGVSTCGQAIPNNSLVINLNLVTTQISRLQKDNSLRRTIDSASPIGNIANYNTMQADIYLGYKAGLNPVAYNGIFFNQGGSIIGSSPYLTSGANSQLAAPYFTGSRNDIVFANVNLTAQNFQPLVPINIGSSCSIALLGGIDLANTSTTEISPNLVCTYNPAVCTSFGTGNTTGACYLPVFATPTIYNNPAGTTSSTFSCPVPGMSVDLSVAPVFALPYSSTGTLQNVPPGASCTIVAWAGPNFITPNFAANGLVTSISGQALWFCNTAALINYNAYILQAACSYSPTFAQAF